MMKQTASGSTDSLRRVFPECNPKIADLDEKEQSLDV